MSFDVLGEVNWLSRSRWRWTNVPLPEPHLLALGAAAVAHAVLPARVPIDRRVARLIGWPTIAAGIGLAAWAVTSASSEGVAIDRPSRLVTTGAFALSRNPMYQGWSLAVLGLGIASRSPWVLAAAAVASAAVDRHTVAEEASLARDFGDEYARYVATTPRSITLEGVAGLVTRAVHGPR